MHKIYFNKMHVNGNDFVIIDNRIAKYEFTAQLIKHLAHRNYGIGCDQLIVINEASQQADCFMNVYNQDATSSSVCGNATLCVAYIMMQEKNQNVVKIATKAHIYKAIKRKNNIKVNMGKSSFSWQDIGLSKVFDTLNIPITLGILKNPAAVSMGNPHMVFIVDDISQIDLGKFGKKLENHLFFLNKANVTIAEIKDKKNILLKVWERGTGLTLACGSAACATYAVLQKKALISNKVTMHLPGGRLYLENDRQEILMSGKISKSFNGTFDLNNYISL